VVKKIRKGTHWSKNAQARLCASWTPTRPNACTQLKLTPNSNIKPVRDLFLQNDGKHTLIFWMTAGWLTNNESNFPVACTAENLDYSSVAPFQPMPRNRRSVSSHGLPSSPAGVWGVLSQGPLQRGTPDCCTHVGVCSAFVHTRLSLGTLAACAASLRSRQSSLGSSGSLRSRVQPKANCPSPRALEHCSRSSSS